MGEIGDVLNLIFSDNNQNEEAILLLCEDGSKETILSPDVFLNRDALPCLRNFLTKLLQLPDEELDRWLGDECGSSLMDFVIQLSSSLTYLNRSDYSALLQTVSDFVIFILDREKSCSQTNDLLLTSLLSFHQEQSFSFTSDLLLYLIQHLPSSVGYKIFSLLFKSLKDLYYESSTADNDSKRYLVDSVPIVKLIVILRRIFAHLSSTEISSLKEEFSLYENIDIWKHIYTL